MTHHYLLWATGEDQPGIVRDVTHVLFRRHCNLEDSSMMKLGSEFGIFLIFSSQIRQSLPSFEKHFGRIKKKFSLNLGIKFLSLRQARYAPANKKLVLITVYGADRPGLVYHVTRSLAALRFNITDLSAHRTEKAPAGYIFFIEGEFGRPLRLLEKAMHQLMKKMNVTVRVKSVPNIRL